MFVSIKLKLLKETMSGDIFNWWGSRIEQLLVIPLAVVLNFLST